MLEPVRPLVIGPSLGIMCDTSGRGPDSILHVCLDGMEYIHT